MRASDVQLDVIQKVQVQKSKDETTSINKKTECEIIMSRERTIVLMKKVLFASFGRRVICCWVVSLYDTGDRGENRNQREDEYNGRLLVQLRSPVDNSAN